MLIECAIADAYGAGFEYVRDRRFISRNNTLAGYVQHPRHKLKPGNYTDDTQMSIAVAELIIEGGQWTPERIAEKFVTAFQRDRREGYAGGFFAFLKKTKTGPQFLENIRSASDKSGAAMRAAPIGVYSSLEEVKEKSRLQASLTHDTPDGTHAAMAVSCMAHYVLHGLGPKSDLPGFLAEHVPGHWTEPWQGEVGSRGWMSVRAALTSLLKSDSLSRLLKSCVAWGGDTDTVAAIALSVGAHSMELEKDLPEKLFNDLENRQFGRDYLLELDRRLLGIVERSGR